MPPPAPRRPSEPSAAQKERNEYIPSFISKKPFYAADETAEADYLEHQRLQSSEDAKRKQAHDWYERGRKLGPAATKFRKGACENCGAMTHKTKECLSRPRKHGAKWTGRDIQADEAVKNVDLGWDAKRDRWNGYDASEYRAVVEEYAAVEEMKKRMKGDDGQGKLTDGNGDDGDAEGGEEGDRYEEETDMGRHQSTSTRNLRLREDTAKYLLNLDLDSARYDPKTRSMVDAGATADMSSALVAEEGFVKKSGDAAEFENAQRAAWEMQERGEKDRIHLQANPTSGEFLRKKEAEEKAAQKDKQRKMLLDKYGGGEYLAKDEKRPAVVENERFVEYDERGKIKGAVPVKTKSSYPEDVMINNHTSVWGSWWKDFQWGYACCHQTVKNTYCTGEEGKRALEYVPALEEADEPEQAEQEEVSRDAAWAEEARQEEHVPNGVEDDSRAAKDDTGRRKRTLEDMRDGVSERELEDYRKRRVMADDPMSKHLGKDELQV